MRPAKSGLVGSCLKRTRRDARRQEIANDTTGAQIGDAGHGVHLVHEKAGGYGVKTDAPFVEAFEGSAGVDEAPKQVAH
jgi:hypothetical protein